MQQVFLTEENIDTIVQSYARDKFTFHQFLCVLIDESRQKLSNQISVYAADLNTKTFFSEKGLKDRKQKIKFKCLQMPKSLIKETEEQEEAKKASGFFEGISDYERCLRIMLLHNTKVGKIISGAHQSHVDRQNGVIRIPGPETAKPVKKPKKGGKKKKNVNVDVTIAFKAEDGHVEQIVVQDNKKKKKAKKPQLSENKENEDMPDLANTPSEQSESQIDQMKDSKSQNSDSSMKMGEEAETEECDQVAGEKSLQALSEINS